VTCGAGNDTVVADRDDEVDAASCESIVRKSAPKVKRRKR
jgi:hypothetical protein